MTDGDRGFRLRTAPEGLFSAFDEFHDFVRITERQSGDAVGASVIDGGSARGTVAQGGAWERHVRDISDAFIQFLRREQVGVRSADHLPGVFRIQQGGAETVMIAAA